MNDNYYKISLSYEIPYNILDSQDSNVISARDILYENLKNMIPERYEKFSVSLTLYQLKDTYNFIVSYEAYIRSSGDLPMEEYVGARDLKDKIKNELEEFFTSVDCEYKQLNIKPIL